MAGIAVLVVVVAVVTVLLGGGLGYLFAKIKYLTDLQAATREREELQKQLAAAVRANGSPQREQKPAAPAQAPATPPAPGPVASQQVIPPAAPSMPVVESQEQQPATSAAPIAGDDADDVPSQAAAPPVAAARPTVSVARTPIEQTEQPAVASASLGEATAEPPTEATMSSAASHSPAPDLPVQRPIVNQSATVAQPAPLDPGSTCTLQQLVAETVARAQSDVLCIVDIDFLRQYRERYGQELGEYVSSHVESVIRETLQAHDAVISRYEGQEFVIAWPAELGPALGRFDAARAIAAQLRANVEKAFLQIGSERLIVTVSIGLALCEAGLPGEHVIARADEALAEAKKAGRNRSYYHNGLDTLPAEPLTTPSEVPGAKNKKKSAADQKKAARRATSERERRRHERKPCNNVNLIAPCTDGVLPGIEKFQRVQFFDISVSGFSMVVPSVPTTSHFAVALINAKGTIFMAAEVANVRQAKRTGDNDKPLLIVGCRFRQRLHPQPTLADSPQPTKTATAALA